MGLDFEDGFEHVGVHPSVRARLVFSWKGLVFPRSVAPFGLCTTPGEFCNLVEFLLECLRRYFKGRLEVINQVDDLSLAFLDPGLTEEEVIEFIESFGWSLNKKKTQHLSRVPVHIGVEWYLDFALMVLPKPKQEKYRAKVDFFLAKKMTVPATLKEVESLCGSLQYVAYIDTTQRPHLRILYKFQAAFKKPGATRKLMEKEIRCLEHWRRYLSQPTIAASFKAPPPEADILIATDASEKGLGILIVPPSSPPIPSLSLPQQKLTAAYPLEEGWKKTLGGYIGNAEAWAVEVAVEILILSSFRNLSILILCDNDNFVKAWAKGWSRNALVNLSILRLSELSCLAGNNIRIEYIESAKNPADPVSRFEPVEGALPFPSTSLPKAPYGTVGGRSPAEQRSYLAELVEKE
ncbi:hypothetical protein JCM11641_002009 [Rhodosporidiobolus odoratus]